MTIAAPGETVYDPKSVSQPEVRPIQGGLPKLPWTTSASKNHLITDAVHFDARQRARHQLRVCGAVFVRAGWRAIRPRGARVRALALPTLASDSARATRGNPHNSPFSPLRFLRTGSPLEPSLALRRSLHMQSTSCMTVLLCLSLSLSLSLPLSLSLSLSRSLSLSFSLSLSPSFPSSLSPSLSLSLARALPSCARGHSACRGSRWATSPRGST